MKNLDARTTMLAQSARVRAHSGREPTAGGARIGANADAFAIIFRRMKDQAAPAGPAQADSQVPRVPDQPRGHSPPTARAETSSLMRFPVRSNISEAPEPPKYINNRYPLVAQDARATGRIVVDRNAAAGMAMRMVDTVSTGETLDARPNAVVQPAPSAPSATAMPTLLTQEAVVNSPAASAEQLVEQPVSGTVANISADNPSTGTATTLEGQVQLAQFASRDVKLNLFPAKARDTAAPSGAAARFMPATPQDHGISAEEAVAGPHAGPMHPGTSVSAFGTLVAGGAFLDRPEEAAGIAGEPLANTANGGAILQLALAPRAERVVPQITGVERVQLLDQVVQVVRMAQHKESTEIIVHLKPDFLGRLSIRVLADDQGMRIEIRAENAIVREVLADNLADLQQRLSEKGLAFDQFNVFAEVGSHSKQRPDRGLDAQKDGPKTAEQGSREAASVETAPLAPNSVIDYFA